MSTRVQDEVDWEAFRNALGDIPSFDHPKLLRAKSRDFFWYSPILSRKLDGCTADLVVQPRTQEELVRVLKLAYTSCVPVTLRGRGGGNYGQAVPAYNALVRERGGTTDLCLDEQEMAAEGLPHVFEFSFNHTTLQVLNVDPSVTYLQVMVPAPIDAARVDAVREVLGNEILMHHEFVRLDDALVAIDLPVIYYTTDERLYEIIRIYEDHGCPVSDPHTFIIEDGGMKNADYRHLAWKKRLDPLGLLNPGKSKEWSRVRDMDPQAIEALHVDT